MNSEASKLLSTLLREHSAALRLYARQWCENADDVVQDALIKLLLQAKLPDKVVPWLYRVVRNGALSSARAVGRRRKLEQQKAEASPNWFLPNEASGLDSGSVTQALQHLPADQRETIVAHLWGGLTFAEIADLMGTSTSSAHRWYEAGIQALRKKLGVAWPEKQTR